MKKLAILFAVSVFIFSACKKDLKVMEPAPSPVQATAMTDIQVNADFNWKTMKNLQVEITSNATAVIYIKSPKGTVYHKAMTTNGERYHTVISVPTFETTLEVLLAGQKRTVPVTNDWISVSFK
ncbi:MAG: hypothetical protein ABIK52_05895 [Bacteroidota bacterium]